MIAYIWGRNCDGDGRADDIKGFIKSSESTIRIGSVREVNFMQSMVITDRSTTPKTGRFIYTESTLFS